MNFNMEATPQPEHNSSSIAAEHWAPSGHTEVREANGTAGGQWIWEEHRHKGLSQGLSQSPQMAIHEETGPAVRVSWIFHVPPFYL